MEAKVLNVLETNKIWISNRVRHVEGNDYKREFYEDCAVKEALAKVSFKAGEISVAQAVLVIIENPKQANYRLKEITKYCEGRWR